MGDVRELLAPGGRFRAAVNYSNTVLAQRNPATGEPRGIVGNLSRRLAARLGVKIEFLAFDSAAELVTAVGDASADIGFIAADPQRERVLAFSQPYLTLEGTYLVPESPKAERVEEADRAGISIAAVEGSAYGLHLARALRHAHLHSCTSSADAAELLSQGSVDLVAGVRQMLEDMAAHHPGWRVMTGRFMEIRQTACIPRSREAALPLLNAFIAEAMAEDPAR